MGRQFADSFEGMKHVLQAEKIARFRALQVGVGAFVMPNLWDGGSARMLAGMGFQALAISSSAAGGLWVGEITGLRERKLWRWRG
jgi:2-methylisocitrate lyase-like PEP mutase family enzyme